MAAVRTGGGRAAAVDPSARATPGTMADEAPTSAWRAVWRRYHRSSGPSWRAGRMTVPPKMLIAGPCPGTKAWPDTPKGPVDEGGAVVVLLLAHAIGDGPWPCLEACAMGSGAAYPSEVTVPLGSKRSGVR
jgi:hypothetical protein